MISTNRVDAITEEGISCGSGVMDDSKTLPGSIVALES